MSLIASNFVIMDLEIALLRMSTEDVARQKNVLWTSFLLFIE